MKSYKIVSIEGPPIKKRHDASENSRLKFGVFIGQLEERYQSLIWPGIIDAGKALDIDLFFFAGAPLQIEYENMAERNRIYDLANSENVDGIILFSGTLANNINSEEYVRFLETYKTSQLVSIALEVKDVPSIITDCNSGIYQAIKHLVEIHGCRKIAYIRGPEGHKEAEQRYQAFKNALASYGIPLNPVLVAPGNFVYTSGEDAARILLDERKVSFDALVAANDRMALGAQAVLEARGFRVPDDIALVGFDGIEEASYTNPPLTTVRQPLYEQGYCAVEVLHAKLHGEAVPLIITMPAEFVVHQSCGCLASSIRLASFVGEDVTSVETDQDFNSKRGQIIADLRANNGFDILEKRDELGTKWLEKIVDSIWVEINQSDTGKFLSVLETTLVQLIDREFEFEIWQNLLTVLRMKLLPLIPEAHNRVKGEDIFHQARILIGEIAERTQAYHRFQTTQESLLLSDIGQMLLSTFDIHKLMDIIHTSLPQLGIRSGYLAIYLDRTH